MTTRLEALVSISQIVLRHRQPGVGIKHRADFAAIDKAIADCAPLIDAIDDIGAATVELYTRYNLMGRGDYGMASKVEG